MLVNSIIHMELTKKLLNKQTISRYLLSSLKRDHRLFPTRVFNEPEPQQVIRLLQQNDKYLDLHVEPEFLDYQEIDWLGSHPFHLVTVYVLPCKTRIYYF